IKMDPKTLLCFAIALWCLVTAADSVCCDEAMVIEYKYNITGQDCDVTGGKPLNSNSDHGCIIKICANGWAMGSFDHFCGKGPCNRVGCECEGGCHRGDWETSFLRNYKDDIEGHINIINMEW
ncbi:hypothetical protein KR044_009050, partial [Drosophila immigrans]